MINYFRHGGHWHRFWIKLWQKEYWPMWVLYFPVFFYWLYLSIRARSFFFFSAVNPTIPTGGMLGESKADILAMLPPAFRAPSHLFPAATPTESVLDYLQLVGWNFPIVLKPDVGERGKLVEKIHSAAELRGYFQQNQEATIVQPYIDYPVELAVLFYRMPDTGRVEVYSVCQKRFLGIVGNGRATIRELILQQDRAVLQLDQLSERFAPRMQEVLPAGEYLELEPIGNHCRGTAFVNAQHLIDEPFRQAIARIVSEIPDVYLGRFDLRCASVADLRAGQATVILEMNGVGAEPAHIYDPQLSLWEMYRVLLGQWRIMYEIARYNHQQRGIPYMSLGETKKRWRRLTTYHARLRPYRAGSVPSSAVHPTELANTSN